MTLWAVQNLHMFIPWPSKCSRTGKVGKKVVKGGWGQCVDSKISTEKKKCSLWKTVTATFSICICTVVRMYVCRLSLSLTHGSPLNIIHPYYISLFFIMIYMPCHGFIMIYTPAPKRAYRRHHIAKRQAFLYRGRNMAFSLSSDSMFLLSYNEPHFLASAKEFGFSCTKSTSQAFIQGYGPQFLCCRVWITASSVNRGCLLLAARNKCPSLLLLILLDLDFHLAY